MASFRLQLFMNALIALLSEVSLFYLLYLVEIRKCFRPLNPDFDLGRGPSRNSAKAGVFLANSYSLRATRSTASKA